ncbi:BppU family phage baseplate upper protein [Anaerosalibacter massiliensis]|uniref:BppU family phage baseplate upper protein n=1 Tax=Anaerosalibacter massiliensis TaxID=1347392 RepID=A0A9X2S6C0_9FIRM|nr:BppU family phage baseplate upper protein [Anaerosalibacter massiliensis]MCR2045480.1 BppU family phage baseplate upper protein [Anaerosalibacter massiliensis]
MDLKDLGLQRLKLNINDDIIEAIVGKEGDHKSRGLEIQILKNDVVTDTTGIELDFYAKPADGKTYMVRAKETNIKQGKYEIVYPSVILQPGKVESEIVLTKGEQVISTKKFDLLVEDTIATDDIVEKSDERPLLAILVEAAKNEKSRIEAENKRVVAEGKRAETENKREQNESQRKSAESQRQKNEEERKSNEVQRQSNESIRQSQESSRISAENARKLSEESRKTVENTRQSNESKRIASESERVKNEDARKANENTRIANEKKREQNRKIVESWIANPSQFNGKDLEFHWNSTKLGVRLKGDSEYQYVDLRGQKGNPGDIGNLTAEHIIEALNYRPASAKEFIYLKNDIRMIDEDITDIIGNVSNNNRSISAHIGNKDIHITKAEKDQIERNKDTIVNNKSEINSLKLELWSHKDGPYHIVESGKNSNGSYIKFSDGTAIGYIPTFELNYEHEKTLSKYWIFPVSFIEIPLIQATSKITNVNARGRHTIILFYESNEQVKIYAHSKEADTFKNSETKVSAFAIGRWK